MDETSWKVDGKAMVCETVGYPYSYIQETAAAGRHSSDDGEGHAAILSGPGRN
jgi:hypothetical protein